MNRPSAFDDDDLDLSQFTPKGNANQPAHPPADLIRQVADVGGFPSRAAQTFVPRREPLTYRTGRTGVFTTKTLPATIDAFYAIARKKGWRVGETFERAVEALLKQEGEGG
jgi:hypothetical protein